MCGAVIQLARLSLVAPRVDPLRRVRRKRRVRSFTFAARVNYASGQESVSQPLVNR